MHLPLIVVTPPQVAGSSARFGTDPFFWNWAMWLVARLVPRR